jgi:hypothetical protein
MEAYAGRQCKFPPPCNEGYEQFKLKGGGPPCCRKINHDKGCPAGKFKCPITGHCIMKRYLKTCGNVSDLKKEIMGLVDTYGVTVKGVKSLPSYMKTLRGIGGKNRTERLNRVKHVLDVCKGANIPLVKNNGRFKQFKTLVSQCKAQFRVPKAHPLENSPESEGYVPIPGEPFSKKLTQPLLEHSDTGSYVPPPFVSFGKRLRPSPCAKLDQVACGGNPNCSYTKRGCVSRKGTRSSGRKKVVYQGPMGAPSAFGGRPSSALLKKCKQHGIKTTVKRGKHRYYRKVSVLKKLLLKKMKKHHHKVPKLSKSILKKCRKYHVKATVKRGKHRVHKSLSLIKRQLRAKGCHV